MLFSKASQPRTAPSLLGARQRPILAVALALASLVVLPIAAQEEGIRPLEPLLVEPRQPLPSEGAPSPAPPVDEEPESDEEKPKPNLVSGARESVLRAPVYDASYVSLPYPDGDPGWERGSGVDLVIRAFRAVGSDLQALVHEDILAAPEAYGISQANPSIDHRRLRNLERFFRRHSQSLEPGDDHRPGDVVIWKGPPGRSRHIGILSDQFGAEDRPLVIHHLPPGPPAEEDVLDAWPVRVRFRWTRGAGEP